MSEKLKEAKEALDRAEEIRKAASKAYDQAWKAYLDASVDRVEASDIYTSLLLEETKKREGRDSNGAV